jgi:hypothetical protein
MMKLTACFAYTEETYSQLQLFSVTNDGLIISLVANHLRFHLSYLVVKYFG